MFGRSRSWVGGGHGKSSRNIHSLDHLKYLYHVLTKNTTVTEQNRNLLVETIRSITEILIWGDQNDSSVFDFFLEKNMFVFFLNILRQKSGRYVCVQLLQTLNILFENISHETSLYYLLSNNYVNSIIVHKFDFSDEEVMAYYISFLKTLSLKLNDHTVHFFYNEHTNDFALYTEAIKFFNHPESMVRIAVRTITLNVYKVDNQAMLHYIRDKTAVPYFSNLVWFIGSHVIELDTCVQTDEEHRNRGKLSDLVAEHLDHLHYLNDILIIKCEFLNDVLTDHLLNRLFLPLYVYSLENPDKGGERPKISLPVSLYLLSQVFLIIHHAPLVNSLAEVILNGDLSETYPKPVQDVQRSSAKPSIRCFTKPTETLERSLEMNKHKGKRRVQKRPNYKNVGEEEDEEKVPTEDSQEDAEKAKGTEGGSKGMKTSGEREGADTFLSLTVSALGSGTHGLAITYVMGQAHSHTQMELWPQLQAVEEGVMGTLRAGSGARALLTGGRVQPHLLRRMQPLLGSLAGVCYNVGHTATDLLNLGSGGAKATSPSLISRASEAVA